MFPSSTLDGVEGTVRIGLLGCGNVGGALVAIIQRDADTIAARTGVRLEIARVAVRSTAKERTVPISIDLLTHDAASVVSDPDVDVVVEVIGGIEPARTLILDALKGGKPVITANKELVATSGPELFAAAGAAGVDLLFEAAVGGGIPLIRPLRESLAGERIHRVHGILNRTTTFILPRIPDHAASAAEALTDAQKLACAERDPTADVEGFDAGAKAAIIASIAFGARVVAGDVYHEGISKISSADIAIAHRLGYGVKLLAIAERDPATGEIAVRVHPSMVPVDHPLASVRDSYNAVFIEGDAVGSLMFYGRGAGGGATASAGRGDLVDASVNLRKGTHGSLGALARVPMRAIDETTAEYQLSLEVVDRPGVLHAVTGVFARHGVSIRAAEQEGLGDDARLVFITHDAREADVQATLHDLRDLDVVKQVGGLLRVVGSRS